MTVLRGVRPAALAAVSERERLRACPHRAQAAVNHARALEALAQAAGESACPTTEEAAEPGVVAKVKGRKRR
jgi:hypothetical protein